MMDECIRQFMYNLWAAKVAVCRQITCLTATGGQDCCRNGFSTASALIHYIINRKWNYNGMSWHFLFGDYCLSHSNKMATDSNSHTKPLTSPSDDP